MEIAVILTSELLLSGTCLIHPDPDFWFLGVLINLEVIQSHPMNGHPKGLKIHEIAVDGTT